MPQGGVGPQTTDFLTDRLNVNLCGHVSPPTTEN